MKTNLYAVEPQVGLTGCFLPPCQSSTGGAGSWGSAVPAPPQAIFLPPLHGCRGLRFHRAQRSTQYA